MSDKIRAKIRVAEVVNNGGSETMIGHAVYSEDPNSENKSFARYTPSFDVRMTIDNPAAQGFFQKGKEYYVDFVKAVEEAAPTSGTTESSQ